jgi:glutamate synthase domain-containing protein 1
MAHNGEINTLRGNVNWMHARQAMCASEFVRQTISKNYYPSSATMAAIRRCSTTALEFLVLSGRSLPHAVMMMIPEPWDQSPVHGRDEKTGIL